MLSPIHIDRPRRVFRVPHGSSSSSPRERPTCSRLLTDAANCFWRQQRHSLLIGLAAAALQSCSPDWLVWRPAIRLAEPDPATWLLALLSGLSGAAGSLDRFWFPPVVLGRRLVPDAWRRSRAIVGALA